MNDIKLPIALRSDGRMVPVADVVSGLDCDCVCPQCRASLVAAKGEIVQHHFRHYTESNCAGALETAMHRYAKQIICDELVLRLPSYDDILGPMRSAKAEQWLDGIRPDVLADYDSEQVAIEIYVAHRVPPEKIENIKARELATLEIDLSRHRTADVSSVMLKRAVLSDAPRKWLFQPAIVRAEIAARAEAARLETERLVEAERRQTEAAAYRAENAKQRAAREAERAIQREVKAREVEAARLAEQERLRENAAEDRSFEIAMLTHPKLRFYSMVRNSTDWKRAVASGQIEIDPLLPRF